MGGREGKRVMVECSGIGKLVRGREAKRGRRCTEIW
jgi:hypothetical protein